MTFLCQQYGFLIGEMIENVEDRMSDSQVHNFDVNSYVREYDVSLWFSFSLHLSRSFTFTFIHMKQLCWSH